MKRNVLAIGLAVMAAFAGATFVRAHIGFITLDSASLSDSKTNIQVGGTLFCDSGETASVSVIVTQSSGKVDNTGVGTSGDIACTGAVQSWTAIVESLTGPAFKKGPATAIVQVFTEDDASTTTVGIHIK